MEYFFTFTQKENLTLCRIERYVIVYIMFEYNINILQNREEQVI